MFSPVTNAYINRLNTKVTCVANETADIAFWLNFPSMIASQAPTSAVMNC